MSKPRRFWRALLRFVQKEFLHILRDARTLALILGLPVLLIGVFGFALTTDVGTIRLLVVSPSGAPFVQRLSARLDSSHQLEVVDLLPPEADYTRLLRSRQIDAILHLEGHFEEKLLRRESPSIHVVVDAVDPHMAIAARGQIGGIVQDFLQEEIGRFQPHARIPLTVETQLLYNPEMHASYYFVPGVMGLVLMIVCAMMTSVSIVREKEYGSMELLLSGPVHPSVILLAKAIPYFLISSLNLTSILLLARYALGVPLAGPLSAILVLSMLFILVSLLLGLFISTITTTQIAAVIASGAGLLLPVSMLSGMIFPIENMPRWLQWIAQTVPAKWYVEGVKKLMIQGVSWEEVQIEMIVLAGMALFLGGVAVLTFKNRLD